jgi:membrane protein
VAGSTIGARVLRAADRVRILREQIEAARERHRSIDVGLRAVERDSEIGGSLLAGAIAYRLFVFLLPFALFLVAGLGLYSDATDREADDLAQDVGVTRLVAEQLATAASDTARWWVLLITVPILAYAVGQLFRSVAIVHALAFAGTGRGIRVQPRSVGLFAAAAMGQFVVVNCVGLLHEWSLAAMLAGVVLAVAALAALWLGVTELVPHGTATPRERLPGAMLYAVGTLGLYVFNALLIGWLVESRADTYGALGAAAALLFTMYLSGRLIVATAVLNAVVTASEREVRNP